MDDIALEIINNRKFQWARKIPFRFQTKLKVEVSQLKWATPVIRFWIRLSYWVSRLSGLGNCIACSRLSVQSLLWFLELTILKKSRTWYYTSFKVWSLSLKLEVDGRISKYLKKSGLSSPKKYCFISFNESALKIVKSVFYFILKAPFVLQIFTFLFCFWPCGKNGLIRKIRLILKFMTSQPGEQTITIHILSISHEVKAVRQWNFVR